MIFEIKRRLEIGLKFLNSSGEVDLFSSGLTVVSLSTDFQLENQLSFSSHYNMEFNLDKIICQVARLYLRRMKLANILSK